MLGQATAYMLGNLDIRKARDGAVPVSFLHEKIRAWGQTK